MDGRLQELHHWSYQVFAICRWHGRNLCGPAAEPQLRRAFDRVFTVYEDSVLTPRLLVKESLPDLRPPDPRHREKKKEDARLHMRKYMCITWRLRMRLLYNGKHMRLYSARIRRVDDEVQAMRFLLEQYWTLCITTSQCTIQPIEGGCLGIGSARQEAEANQRKPHPHCELGHAQNSL